MLMVTDQCTGFPFAISADVYAAQNHVILLAVEIAPFFQIDGKFVGLGNDKLSD